MKKTTQQMQDDIFRKMSVERKIRLASSFWHSAKQISGTDRIYLNIDGIREYIKKRAKRQKTLALLQEMINLVK